MFRTLNHKTYICGGSVRDELMGLESNDTDYVIACGKEEFESVFPDAKLVGIDFPVYLHPETGDEISLTRTEKSSGDGYGDFVVTGIGVPIEEDLYRRDLIINSMAKHYLTGEIIDPYNGVQDIEDKVIRVINPNAFSEDPVRILRCLRFAVRFGFTIDIKTQNNIMFNVSRLQFVTKERIEKELNKLYDSDNVYPSVMFFEMLHILGGLKYIFNGILHEMTLKFAGPEKYHGNNTILDHVLQVCNRVELTGRDYKCFIAGLFHDIGKTNTPEKYYGDGKRQHINHENRGYDLLVELFKTERFSKDVMELSLTVAKLHMKVHYLDVMRPHKLIEFYRQIPKRYYDDFFLICNCDHPLTEAQLEVKNKLDKLRDYVYDEAKIKLAKDKRQEVTNQLVRYYKSL